LWLAEGGCLALMLEVVSDAGEVGTWRARALPRQVSASWVHAAVCVHCRLLLSRDDEVRQRLELLRIGEPRIDVLDQVMAAIAHQS
jgi:hypothetical protein